MRCNNCGSENRDDAKFCRKCGEVLKDMPKSPNSHSGTRKTKRLLVIGITMVLLLVIGAIAYLFFTGKASNSSPINDDDRYVFDERVLNEIDASSSDTVPTTAELASSLSQRGFESALITSTYDLDGNQVEEEQLDPSSTEKHPLYNVYYVTPSGTTWIIYVCNGSFMAYPAFLYDPSTPGYMIVEEEYVTSYSSNENKFIQSIPGESELVMKRVDEINAAVLDGLDKNGIEGL